MIRFAGETDESRCPALNTDNRRRLQPMAAEPPLRYCTEQLGPNVGFDTTAFASHPG